nr:hypothetical protein [Mucilaginibacter sp. X4EP1]
MLRHSKHVGKGLYLTLQAPHGDTTHNLKHTTFHVEHEAQKKTYEVLKTS